MLNRRTLRIKIMQTLFAFEQCKQANHLLSLDHLDDRFRPDLNSMEVQDKELLSSQRKSSRLLFEKKFKDPETTGGDEIIIKTVDEALALYHKNVKRDFNYLQKNMILEVEALNNLYHTVLGLLISFGEVAGGDKKINHKNFSGNVWIKALSENADLKKELVKGGLTSNQEQVRGWFKDVIKPDSLFQKFNEEKSPDVESQKTIVKHIVRKLILGKGPIHDQYEEDIMRWAEDKDIIKSLVDKTIKSFDETTGKIELQKLTLDWDDDKDFMKKLFEATVHLDAEHKLLIAKNTRNWEVDRLPLTDLVIIEMAIAELITFPGIPVKVSINEYIELAKEYSTPKSRQFINGILDVISKELYALGVLKKSGRGLIDNK
ncbi:MAG: transcription antitermination factor NusB [Bacteroidia bacterium]|nr:transcription antitermination factor NusB [Bacteroidia bacterium]